MTAPSPILNLDQVHIESPDASITGPVPDGYDLRSGEIARRIGAQQLGYRLIAVGPGKRSCPFHSHRAEEEMFLVLEGEGELRYSGDRYRLRTGDVIACPVGGPETAHQIINTGDIELRYLALSTRSDVEVCEYPDSNKLGTYAGRAKAGIRHLTRASDARDYWEGE